MIAEATGGGVRRHLLDLLEGLDSERFSFGLVYGTERADSRFLEALPRLAESVELFELPALERELSPTRDAKALAGIIGAIRAFRPDVVHCHSSKAGALGRTAAKLCGVKRIFYTPHAYSFQSPALSSQKRAFYLSVERGLSRFATTATLNVSQGERNCAIAAGLDRPEKFHVIYNGVEQAAPQQGRLRPLLGLSPEIRLVGCAARIDAQKDPMTFLEIVRQTAALPKLCFVWFGDGPLAAALREKRDALELSSRLLLPGYLPDADLLVGELDYYLSTALYEGMPYAPIEALRAGVLMVATDVIGNNEVALPQRSGLLFPVGDSKTAARLLCDELSSPTLTAAGARAVYAEYFTLERMLRGVEALYLAERSTVTS